MNVSTLNIENQFGQSVHRAFNVFIWFRNINALIEIDNEEVPILDGSSKVSY